MFEEEQREGRIEHWPIVRVCGVFIPVPRTSWPAAIFRPIGYKYFRSPTIPIFITYRRKIISQADFTPLSAVWPGRCPSYRVGRAERDPPV